MNKIPAGVTFIVPALCRKNHYPIYIFKGHELSVRRDSAFTNAEPDKSPVAVTTESKLSTQAFNTKTASPGIVTRSSHKLCDNTELK
jgi:hypothetical protein